MILFLVQLVHSVQRKVFMQYMNAWIALVEISATKLAWLQQQDLVNPGITVHLVQQVMKNSHVLQAITVDWALSILLRVLQGHIQMAVNYKRLMTALIADQDITAMTKG